MHLGPPTHPFSFPPLPLSPALRAVNSDHSSCLCDAASALLKFAAAPTPKANVSLQLCYAALLCSSAILFTCLGYLPRQTSRQDQLHRRRHALHRPGWGTWCASTSQFCSNAPPTSHDSHIF